MLMIAGTALLVSITIVMLRRKASFLGLLDYPDGQLKQHHGAIPLVGGLAIFVGLLPAFAWQIHQDPTMIWAVGGALLLVIVGALDDRGSLGVGIRFLVQILAAGFLVLGAGVQLQTLGDLLGFGAEGLGHWGVVLTLIGVVGVINAVNMVDGIDGLAAGLTLVAIAGLWIGAGQLGIGNELLLSCLTVGLLIVLAHNLGFLGDRRRVFLGDAGSKLIGYLLAWQMIANSQTGTGIDPVTAIWLLGVPLINNFLVVGRRLLQGHSPFNGFRDHLHDVLGELLPDSRYSLAMLLSLALVMAALGVGFQWLQAPDYVSFYTALVIFGLSALAYTYWMMKKSRRDSVRSVSETADFNNS